MNLRTKLEKLEKELKHKGEERKIVIEHRIINEKGEVEEVKVKEITLKGGVRDEHKEKA